MSRSGAPCLGRPCSSWVLEASRRSLCPGARLVSPAAFMLSHCAQVVMTACGGDVTGGG